MILRSFAFAIAGCVSCWTVSAAQDRPRAFLAASAGLSHDLGFQSGLDENGATVRLELLGLAVSRLLMLGAGITYRPFDSPDVDYVFTELAVQSRQLTPGLRPYFGFGGGLAVPLQSGSGRVTYPTLYGTGGMNLDVSRTWALHGEVRFRAISIGGAATIEITAGAALHLH